MISLKAMGVFLDLLKIVNFVFLIIFVSQSFCNLRAEKRGRVEE